jgi:tetratricopeptide (TPR) repeat protein
MHVRRTILCLATIFFWVAHDPGVVSGQSSELMEAYNSFITLYQQGRYAAAEPYAKEALRLGTEEFGPNDPSTATSLNNLAALYQAQGHYAEAEPLYQRALAIREKALGPEHPHVAMSLENYAALLRQTARTDEAERMEARAKAIRAKAR